MVKAIKPGEVLVGHELGHGLSVGDTLEIRGKEFKVAQILPEYGEQRDVQLLLDLSDAQAVLEKEGRINQIMALNCKCKGDRISLVRKEVEGVLPDTKVTEHRTRAEAREMQRDKVAAAAKQEIDLLKQNRGTTQRWLTVLMSVLAPGVVVSSAAVVGLLSWLNIRDRRHEIGVLRALGKRGIELAALLLSRLALTGFLGGLLGVALCYGVLAVAPGLLTAESFEFDWSRVRPGADLLILALLLAPLVSLLAGYLPVLIALRREPAASLMDA